MTTFSYTSGNPANLVGGTTANMADISGPFTDVRTFVNGSIDDTNVTPNSLTTASLATSAKPVTLLGQYHTIAECESVYVSGQTSSAYMLTPQTSIIASGTAVSGTTRAIVPLTTTDYSVSGLTAKFRLRGVVCTNATSPAVTFTFGLYPVLSTAGGANLLTLTLDAVVSGSTAATTPVGSTVGTAVGTDFTPPTSGVYVLGVSLNGTTAANSAGLVYARLEAHHI